MTFIPNKETTQCSVTLEGGESVVMHFRAFTLADLDWMQKTFDTEEKRMILGIYDKISMCKVVWRLLTPESKSTFTNIKFVDYDDDKEEEFERSIKGHEKLMYVFADELQLVTLYGAASEVQNINNFIVPRDTKKKTMKS